MLNRRGFLGTLAALMGGGAVAKAAASDAAPVAGEHIDVRGFDTLTVLSVDLEPEPVRYVRAVATSSPSGTFDMHLEAKRPGKGWTPLHEVRS